MAVLGYCVQPRLDIINLTGILHFAQMQPAADLRRLVLRSYSQCGKALSHCPTALPPTE